jgi:hypothetical protein
MLNFLDFAGRSASLDNVVVVNTKSDFPTPINNVITLAEDKTYYVSTMVDLTGDRIVTSGVCNLFGYSSEVSTLTSTGLGVGVPLITSEWTIVIENITIKDVHTAIDINGNTRTIALDWENVNFTNVPNVGIINTSDNFIYETGAFLGSEGLVLTGTVGTISLTNSLFRGIGNTANIIEVNASAIITRRFRVTYSSFVVLPNNTGINFNVAATVPFNSYILDTVNFSSSGTFISGVDYTNNKSSFNNNVGIINSREITQYGMINNAVATTIALQSVAYKVLGTTVSGSLTSKFTNTNNRATFIGKISKIFVVNATMSINSGNNNQIGIYIAKNGTILTESEVYITTNSSGRAESANVQAVLVMQANDYIEVFVGNDSSTSSVTVTDLNVIAR